MAVIDRIRALVERLSGFYVLRAEYFPRGVKLQHDIEQHLPQLRTEVVFDVGANVGQSARKYLAWFAGAQIFCFEPVEATYLELRERLKSHRQVHCYHLALGASDSTGNMVHRGSSDMFFLAKTGKESQYQPDELEEVQILTLDHFCRDHAIQKISYLKIDTEGNDLEVLKGADGMLKENRIDLVEVEAGMHPGNTRHVPFEVLKKHLEQRQYFVFALYEQMEEWSEDAPHLRRTNPVFVSRRAIEANKKVGPGHA